MTDKARLLAEILEYTQLPAMREGDILISDFMASTGLLRDAATYQLNKLVKEGLLETAMVKCPDRRTRRAYRRASRTEG